MDRRARQTMLHEVAKSWLGLLLSKQGDDVPDLLCNIVAKAHRTV